MEGNNRFHKCRLCLKIGDFCSIFEKDDTIKLSEMVMSFANVQIHEGDGLSDRVCTACMENLSTAYLFKQQCERIDALMRKFPDVQIDKPEITNYDDLYKQEFTMHTQYINEENDENLVKSADSRLSPCFETSDETDSDIDSVKCVYCNQSYNYGTHTCHVTCTIEHNALQRSSSNETLVATDTTPTKSRMATSDLHNVSVSCVLCDEKFERYESYVIHLNKCTTNVKLHHFVCPVCHDMFNDKFTYLEHLKVHHFKEEESMSSDPGIDCVDFSPIVVKTRKPLAVRRQIGWSVEDIYQEIDCHKVEPKPTPTASPLRNFFSKLGNE